MTVPDLNTLLHYLTSERVEDRQQAAIELSRMTDERIIEPLLVALDDDDATVRANAAAGLGQNKAGQAVPALIDRLQDEQDIVRERAATALAQIGDGRAIPALIDALDAGGVWARNRIIYVLGASQAAEAVEPLIVQLEADDPSTQGVAAWALAALGDLRALDPLRALLSASDASVRGNVAYALGELGQADDIPRLRDCLRDRDPAVRGKAAWALGNLAEATSDTSMVADLIGLLEDYAEIRDSSAHLFVCQYAAEALTQIGTTEALAAVEAWKPAARQHLLPHRIDDLIRALRHRDLQTRERAFAGLQEIGAPAVPSLLEALGSSDYITVRQGAAQALGLLGDTQAVPALVMALADADSGVWSQAVAALAKLGKPAEKALRPMLASKKPQVKQGAAIALWRINREERAFKLLLSALQADDVVVRGSAITSLWMQPDERAVATLQIQLGQEPVGGMMAKYILQALDTIGGSMATATIANYLADHHDQM